MKYILLLLCISCFFTSCWKAKTPYTYQEMKKVWGSKPIYAADSTAKIIRYIPQKQVIVSAGNIYAMGNYIFQIDNGRGIHVIDNTIPAQADRIGFIVVNGCAQISIKGTYIYTNSYADLVTLDMANPLCLHEVNRIKGAFPEFLYSYPLAQPEESGYYICPRYDSVVVGWVKDSIYSNCYKN